MKQLMIIVLLGLIVSQVSAQKIKESEVPKVVKGAFMKAYPTAKEVKWEKEDDSFVVSFNQNKKDMSSCTGRYGYGKGSRNGDFRK